MRIMYVTYTQQLVQIQIQKSYVYMHQRITEREQECFLERQQGLVEGEVERTTRVYTFLKSFQNMYYVCIMRIMYVTYTQQLVQIQIQKSYVYMHQRITEREQECFLERQQGLVEGEVERTTRVYTFLKSFQNMYFQQVYARILYRYYLDETKYIIFIQYFQNFQRYQKCWYSNIYKKFWILVCCIFRRFAFTKVNNFPLFMVVDLTQALKGFRGIMFQFLS
eukprot:TRINITY_DN23682_c0_g1_i1.p3 TRINITY_DN23682_c0_g1~~TRINITY_DN23682_c0_g1_i1.p3  ORF type:complete len:222 (+),score=-10.92 TRINITY_DN23682_c0_g1_i1:249-914(+)